MIDPERLVKPEDKFREAFPALDFRDEYVFHTSGEWVLVTDPTYLADVYNSQDEESSYLRTHGVFVMNFGGDTNSPAWYKAPYLLLPISMHLTEEIEFLRLPEGATVLAEEVKTDSGSFIFLPLTSDFPPQLYIAVREVIAQGNGVALPLSPGNWNVYYEQWDPIKSRPTSWYRNIVVKRE